MKRNITQKIKSDEYFLTKSHTEIAQPFPVREMLFRHCDQPAN